MPEADSPPPYGDEAGEWRALARQLGLRFFDTVTVAAAGAREEPPAPAVFHRAEAIRIGADRDAVLVSAPQGVHRAALAAFLAAHPEQRDRVAIATPRTIRQALIARWGPALTRRARRTVLDRDRSQSAVGTPTPWQMFLALAAALVWLLATFGVFTPMVIGWTALFLVIGLFRTLISDRITDPPPYRPVAEADLPSWAVLVPLHREADVVADLVAALGRIDYPADRLSIRLVVEADDAATRRAAERATASGPIEVIAVPPSRPRTKPKALDFALATIDTAFVTVYDAEDRPDPDQLRRAAAAFRDGSADLAVVQAALEIDHAEADRSWLVRQFELEYAMLFHGLLPWLAERRLFLPLGGTSNHFRRAALDAVGAWDPHNVTEDADIAVRLRRGGWTSGVIASVTLEEAPTDARTWQLQRVRWLKGWMQTWLAHMRRPIRMHRELGWADALTVHIILAGQLISAFAFAPSFVLLALQTVGLVPLFGDRFLDGDVVLMTGLVGYASGIVGSWILALTIGEEMRRKPRLFDVITMPLYWCGVSVAAYRAAVELVLAPSQWNKTRHGVARRGAAIPDESPSCTSPPGEAMRESLERV